MAFNGFSYYLVATQAAMVTWCERDREFVSTNVKGVLKLEMQKRDLRVTCGRERAQLGIEIPAMVLQANYLAPEVFSLIARSTPTSRRIDGYARRSPQDVVPTTFPLRSDSYY